MSNISIFGTLSNVHILCRTLLFGKRVGVDARGNKYFRGRKRHGLQHERRWVIYKGAPEASTVEPEWHGWLHYQTDTVPEAQSPYRKEWQKPYIPNMTGTKEAYLPPAMKGKPRDHATGDYTAWQPPQ